MTFDRPRSPPGPAAHGAALEELVRRYLSVLFAPARRQLPDPKLAKHVAQALFVVLARRRGVSGATMW